VLVGVAAGVAVCVLVGVDVGVGLAVDVAVGIPVAVQVRVGVRACVGVEARVGAGGWLELQALMLRPTAIITIQKTTFLRIISPSGITHPSLSKPLFPLK
jgi:hypothetical protein